MLQERALLQLVRDPFFIFLNSEIVHILLIRSIAFFIQMQLGYAHVINFTFIFVMQIVAFIFVLNWAVFKFVEQPENNDKVIDQKSKVKFKIMSLKVKGGIEYAPELVSLIILLSFLLFRLKMLTLLIFIYI